MDRPFGGDHPELGQVTAERIDGLGALANQKIPRAKHNGCGLLVRALEGHKPHGRALGGLADRFGIGHVVLLALDKGLHVSGRDQLHRVAELGNLAAPKVSAATCFQGHRAGREGCKERENLAAAQLLAKDNSSRAVGSVQLKDVLGEIQSDGAHLVHGRLLEWALTPPLWHADAVGGRPHHQARRRTDRSGESGVNGRVPVDLGETALAQGAGTMCTAGAPSGTYRFDHFTLDLGRGALLARDGAEVPLRPKSFALLRLLVENTGRLLDRDTTMEALWPGVFVTDESIAQCIKD